METNSALIYMSVYLLNLLLSSALCCMGVVLGLFLGQHDTVADYRPRSNRAYEMVKMALSNIWGNNDFQGEIL